MSDDVARQLIEIGVDKKQAKANGDIVAAAMVNFAKREGLSPEAFYKKLGLTFVRDEVTGESYLQTSYHGSPHRGIKKMSLNKVGSGEGAQAFGWGSYSAELRKIAERYREKLKRFLSRGQLYRLEIPESDALLDWDKPLNQQPEQVKNAILKAAEKHGIPVSGVKKRDPRDEDFNKVAISGIEYVKNKAHWVNQYGGKLQGPLLAAVHMVKDAVGDSDKALEDAQRAYVKMAFSADEDTIQFIREVIQTLRSETIDFPVLEARETVEIPGVTSAAMLGEDFYRRLSEILGSDKAASLALKDAGLSGLQYLDGMSRSEGEGSHNFVIWNEDAMQVMETYYQMEGEEGGPRGAINLFDPGRVKITLTPRADVTTTLHELGHLFRWIMERQASQFQDDARLQADWEEVQKFGGHEKFADGFIEYVKTGEAPSSTLRRAFEQFKQWLRDFYNAIRGNTGIELSDEMRGVFDRILAGEPDILNTKKTKTLTGRQFEPRPPEGRGESPESVTAFSEIREKIEEILPWRHGKTPSEALGIFKEKPEVMRSKYKNDLPVILHELGHFLDKRLGLSNAVDPDIKRELTDGGKIASGPEYTEDQVRGEGAAQFFLRYAANDGQAQEEFPVYYAEFEKALAKNPELQKQVAEIKERVSSYYQQTPRQRESVTNRRAASYKTP